MNQRRSVNDRTIHSYFVVPAWLFLISQQFENLEAGPETQVLAIVALPISRCLSRWRKKEPSTFDASDCGVTEPVPLVQRSLHSSSRSFSKKKKKRKKKDEGETRDEKKETQRRKRGKEERKKRNITVRSDIFNRVRNNGERRVLLKIVERKKVNLQFTAFSESSGNLLAALSS